MNSDLTEILRDNIHVPDTLLTPGTSIEDAGLDSLAVVELSMLLSERLGITVDDAQIARTPTLGALDSLVEEELHGRAAR